MISIIAAMDRNQLIGKENRIPWRIHEDLAYFRKVTMGHVVVMGRKTYESLNQPLDGRTNVILTHRQDYRADGCIIMHSVEEVLVKFPNEEVFIIGGAEVFKLFLPYAEKLYLTQIDNTYQGDTWFPEFDKSKWQLDSFENHTTSDNSKTDFAFLIYSKK